MSTGRTAGWVLGLALVAVVGWLWLTEGARRGHEVAVTPGADVPESARVVLSEPSRPTAEERAPAIPAAEAGDAEEPRSRGTAETVTIRVVRRADQRGVAGAEVEVGEGPAAVAATTDERGLCALPVDRSGECVTVSVHALGLAPVCGCFQLEDEHTFELARMATLSGRVLAADTNLVVPGARISMEADCGEDSRTTVRAGDDGSYELAGVKLRESLALVVEAHGFPRQVLTFELRSDEPRVEADLRLERGLEIHGRVVDFESGAGIPGARVDAIVADGNGVFRGPALPRPGSARLELMVVAEGHSQLHCSFELEELAEPLELRLPRGAVIEGVVRDEAGQPIAGARVSAGPDHPRR